METWTAEAAGNLATTIKPGDLIKTKVTLGYCLEPTAESWQRAGGRECIKSSTILLYLKTMPGFNWNYKTEFVYMFLDDQRAIYIPYITCHDVDEWFEKVIT